ncbi:MAG TPA: gamma-glutamylcyclotransferase family protein [Flavobacterium sp.]|uniref:Gamma-glutamylcyclotransferase n=1 Tax=Flavobacterium commune TaxID=1306519 RepID=A0A1D9P6S1_9FLAO|nr:gamma-glutamylcyclotransferase family protein [Flavobacterium commune]AOZ98288.1 gamma-glutamylcyclotransferase [Flavobacterium commune]HTG65306.1 gamma-glutamylcyclotransferase family protein [Flavobacterium sp.]
MEKLFAYGTLKNKEIQENIFGRTLKGTPDRLIGFVINYIEIEEEFGLEKYPIIVATNNPDDIVTGVVYDISEKDVYLADTYEGLHYKRIEVTLESLQTAWAYIVTN